jgi:hypothetical protein
MFAIERSGCEDKSRQHNKAITVQNKRQSKVFSEVHHHHPRETNDESKNLS